ncbi:autotransporter outer membrane beta-barrel domain-containing protein [Aquabacter sediminis]|uniref:autotransporter outer membrane beta-barrel domain-containing protein n=1 Tax=Aquabacter sediminis TaxID=3029197 RepID=UPI00237ECFEE|nr:autotransporter outer membrane beta-barrel domain-containing protein [Aquabacter sp. P-9]MDE1571198.1 autotransporter outer membrane beta-barrel domain-containing protein [Aquabacter sp. P-9]
MALGGSGGSGGTAGGVTVVLDSGAPITTAGLISPGIVAQSIGGSGGAGGFSAGAAGSIVFAADVTLAGNGGSGGGSGAVKVTSNSLVTTSYDQSIGILAQSIGGNGGNGGFALAGAGSTGGGDAKVSVGGAAATGGSGGSGQTAGSVTVYATNISTQGYESIGILAQSIGGSGGNGGSSRAFSVSGAGSEVDGYSASVAIGGAGSSGGTGGSVTVQQVGGVQVGTGSVTSDLAPGIFAQSVGGSGGNGGSADANAIASTASVSVAVGGGGGQGSNGGTVSAQSNSGLNSGSVVTYGAQSPGVIGQSIGGGGGNGGWSQATASSNQYAAGIAIGGYGAGGGAGGTVTLDVGGTVVTHGDHSAALFAQSVGGGGGNGGAASSTTTAGQGSELTGGVTSVAGAGVANDVNNVNSALSNTNSSDKGASTASKTQPDNGIAVSLAIGGNAGQGGGGNTVSVTSTGALQTYGTLSHAIFAQSVGGGGGNGGSSSTNADGSSYAASVTLGGGAGTGGTGGGVTVDLEGTAGNIYTSGQQAYGIFAQSVGGGGGNGGSAASSATGGQAAVSFSLGGNGASGATGGAVTVEGNTFSLINTLGAGAIGLFAQSVGGGGGSGGSSTTSSSAPGVQSGGGGSSSSSTGSTSGSASSSQTASSAGNNGGTNAAQAGADGGSSTSGGNSLAMSMGGSAGTGGDGGGVTVNNYALIFTGIPLTSLSVTAPPDNAPALFAQSVGGGGGNGGSSTSNASANEHSVSLALGGSGASGGTGGEVQVTTVGTLQTAGNNSAALIAQSVGGGGGNGGASNTTSTSGGTMSLALGLGGNGAGGGDGGTVNVTVNAPVSVSGYSGIATLGVTSYGVFAQSVGGGGGSGGAFISTATGGSSSSSGTNNSASGAAGSTSSQASSGVALAMGLGGSGGGGGGGGTVSATISAPVTTSGAQSHGIFAQSVGGGGGAGGSSTTNANSGSYAVSLALGGSGGTGGAGGNVTVTQNSNTITYGAMSYGIFAQSVSGGGGFGGASNATTASGGEANIGVALGGSGASSLPGGTVTVTANAGVLTNGANAVAVLGQSVGGGGGVGGSSTSSTSDGKISASLGLGGTGGTGNDGGAVTVSAYSPILTNGANASGLVAQSIGGGGGIGGSSTGGAGGGGDTTASLALGGTGGAAGNGGAVSLTFDNYGTGTTLTTYGAYSYGLVAQSVGGGGGMGGSSNGSATGSGDVTATLSLGGSGTSGGAGGGVTVNTDNAYTVTFGLGAVGVLVQSIGGGGGAGGTSDVSATGGNATSGAYAAGLALGGNGSGGGAGGTVLVNNWMSTATMGAMAPAVLVQSIAGGGGLAASTTGISGNANTSSVTMTLGGTNGLGAQAGTVTLNNYGPVQTSGMDSHGIMAQSIAGGGGYASTLLSGNGTTAVTIDYDTTLGANGTGSGDANTVFALYGNNIVTAGTRSIGLIAQSIGGGGGVTGLPIESQSSSTFNGTVTLGGSAGGAGLGVTVQGVNGWSVSTQGNYAHGLVAQSIGGGGGISTLPAQTLVLGGTGGGAGGTVSVSTTGKINTTGAAAIGIIAQSIGGGGGVGKAEAAVQFAGTSGDASAVTVTVGGVIKTTGTNSVGVLAQSIGGGGGAAIADNTALTYTGPSGSASGTGGAVTVNVNADITTSGAGAYGVLAQSASQGGGLYMYGNDMVLLNGNSSAGGKVTYTQAAGVTVSATGSLATAVYTQGPADPILNIGAGARVIGGAGGTAITSDGAQTTLTSYGSLSTVDGAEGLAIRTLNGFAEVVNGGTITGNIALQSGAANTVMNLAGGTIAAGSSFDLGGSGNVLTNAGTLRSAASSLGNVSITGALVQTSSGVLVVRTDQVTGLSDRYAVSGSASLSGGVMGVLANPGLAKPGQYDTAFLSAAGGLSASSLVALGDTAMLDFSVSQGSGGLTLGTAINFTPAGLSGTGQELGALVGIIQAQGSSPLFEAIVPALLEQPTVGRLEQSYQSVGGGAVSLVPMTILNSASASMAGITTQMDLWRMGLRPSSTALSYAAAPAASGTATSASGATGNRYFWGAPVGAMTTGGGLSGSSFGGTVGLDGELANGNALLGAAVNFSTTNLWADDYGASVSTSYGGFSVYGLHQWGPAYVSAIATLGYGSSNFDRNLYNLGLNLATSSGLDGMVLGGRIEVGYSFAMGGGAQVTPFLAFQPSQLWLGSGSELFSLGRGLTYDSTSVTALPIYVGLQWDGQWTLGNGQRIAPYVRAAWMHDFSPDRGVSRSFAELPGLTFTGSPIPTVTDAADLHAGLQFSAGPNTVLSAGFDAQLADSYSTIGVSGSFRVRW